MTTKKGGSLMGAFETGLAVYAATHSKTVWEFVLRFWKYAFVLVIVLAVVGAVLVWGGFSLKQHFTEPEKPKEPAESESEPDAGPEPFSN